jgi:hypothetical protein
VLVAFGAGLAWAAGVVRWGTAGVEPPCCQARERTTAGVTTGEESDE